VIRQQIESVSDISGNGRPGTISGQSGTIEYSRNLLESSSFGLSRNRRPVPAFRDCRRNFPMQGEVRGIKGQGQSCLCGLVTVKKVFDLGIRDTDSLLQMDAVLPLKKRCCNFDRDLSIRAGTVGDPEVENASSVFGRAKTEVSNRYLWLSCEFLLFRTASKVGNNLRAEIQVSRLGRLSGPCGWGTHPGKKSR
jgi:hypothetical protein